ncbi:MAG: HRDC domain-containing protein [Planctomycetota bacterium]
MRAKVITLRFSPQLGRFDDAPLIALQQKIVLEQMREHLVQIGGEAMLLCVATWREKAEGSMAAVTNNTAPPSPTAATTGEAPAVTRPEPESREAAGDRHGQSTPVGELRADFTPEQQVLFDLVRRWRRQKAHQEGVPPYVVLTNRQLVELVVERPASKTAMGKIAGFGDKKLARHGEELLMLLWPEAPPNEQPESSPPPVATTAAAEATS